MSSYTMSYTDNETIKRFLGNYALTFEEERKIIDWARNCANFPVCPDECPLMKYKVEMGETSCAEFFAKFIATYGTLIPTERDVSSLNDLANNCIKICNEIKAKTKRETPMRVVVSHSNGKTIYHCYNCGKPLFIQPSTQYCECCGQKLSFEVVENEI